jgi:transcriptional regulator with XRE-family HTH domain
MIMAEPDANLGSRLRQARERRGLGVNDLARQSGVNAGIISQIESGQRTNLLADSLRKLADTLQVSTDYLLGRTGKETLDPDAVGANGVRVWQPVPSAP